MADYMAQLSESVGLPYYPKQGPFETKKGAIIGARDGYLIAIGLTKQAGQSAALGVLLRFKAVSRPEQVRAAIEAASLKPSRAKMQVDNTSLLLIWPYALSKPKPTEVANLIRAMIDRVGSIAQGLDGRCEKCQSAATQVLLLRNGVPGYYCDGCQQRIRQELDVAAVDYENKQSDIPRGAVLGIVVAALGSLAWGGMAFAIHRIFLYGAIGIGYLIGWAVVKGMGKINRVGQTLVFALTVASVLVGDMFFYTLSGMKQFGLSSAPQVFRIVNAHFWEWETRHGIGSIIFALIGAGFALYRVRKPKFTVRFDRLGSPAS